MKPRSIRVFDRISRIVAGSRCVPSPFPTPLYCAIRTQTGTRANLLSNGNTACQIAPPTFSKYTSIPCGQAAAMWAGKVDAQALDLGAVLAEGVEHRLATAPVICGSPVVDQSAHPREQDAL